MTFFKTLFYILIFYYSFKLISRILAPILLRYFFRKAQNNMNKGFQNQNKSSKDGDVHFSKKTKSKTLNKDVGEYIDFEEVEEND